MKNIWKKHKVKIIALAYIIAAVIFVRYAIMTAIWKIKDKAGQIERKILDDDMNYARLSRIPEMEEDFNFTEENAKYLNVILSPDEEVDFIKKIENIAQDTGNSVTLKIDDAGAQAKVAAKPKKDTEKTILDKLSYSSYITMQINLKGDYQGLISFIKKLENTRYYVNITSLVAKASTKTSEKKTEQKPISQFGVFASPESSANKPSASDQKTAPVNEDILESTLNVVIYRKK